VGLEVALALRIPLDILVVKKLGYPGNEEYAMGAIAPGGIRVLKLLPGTCVGAEEVERISWRQGEALELQQARYKNARPHLAIAGRTVLLVDDGAATGTTLQAAVLSLRAQHAARICVAIPVGSRVACEVLKPIVDHLICVAAPNPFRSVSLWYRDFTSVQDEEVVRCLGRAPAGDGLRAR